jgi:hypothetical protein
MLHVWNVKIVIKRRLLLNYENKILRLAITLGVANNVNLNSLYYSFVVLTFTILVSI